MAVDFLTLCSPTYVERTRGHVRERRSKVVEFLGDNYRCTAYRKPFILAALKRIGFRDATTNNVHADIAIFRNAYRYLTTTDAAERALFIRQTEEPNMMATVRAISHLRADGIETWAQVEALLAARESTEERAEALVPLPLGEQALTPAAPCVLEPPRPTYVVLTTDEAEALNASIAAQRIALDRARHDLEGALAIIARQDERLAELHVMLNGAQGTPLAEAAETLPRP